jgi:hypothetical protein
MDASIPLAAAIRAQYLRSFDGEPALGRWTTVSTVRLSKSSLAPTGPKAANANPLPQGLSADLAHGHRPNNTLGGIPTLALDYSPAWDANLYTWTQDAINNGYRGQLREEFNILIFVQDGLLTGVNGAVFGSAGFSINCPIVLRLD